MGLFDFFYSLFRTPRIPRKIFIEDADPNNSSEDNNKNNTMDINANINSMANQNGIQGRELIDEFLSKDYEPDGYQDALVNPDSTYAEFNKTILKYQLELKINQALTYYNFKIKDYDFLIKTRKENGMMDTVAEIESEKGKATEEIDKIKIILDEARENKGIGYMIILSYDRGFKRGLAALTAAKLYGKDISNE